MAPPLGPETARRALGIPRDAFAIGWVGRVSYEKGPDVLLEAMRHAGDVPLTVSVVGGGDMRVALQAKADGLGLAGRLRWHGAVPDAGRLFPAFDVCVLSSRTEGTPMVLFEAMAAGVPIVTARVGGVPDVVSSAEAALVPPADPVALAAAIRAVYHDPALARARAKRARVRLLTNFAVGRCISRYDAIYRLVTIKAPADGHRRYAGAYPRPGLSD